MNVVIDAERFCCPLKISILGDMAKAVLKPDLEVRASPSGIFTKSQTTHTKYMPLVERACYEIKHQKNFHP